MAVNAAKRAKANWLQAFGEEKEFYIFSVNPNTAAWEKQGELLCHLASRQYGVI